MENKFSRFKDENDFDYKARLLKYKLEDKEDIDWQEIVNLLNLSCSSDHLRKTGYGFLEAYNYLKNNNSQETKEVQDKYKATIELNKDGSQSSDKLILMSEEDCKDVNFLLKAHGYTITSWELLS